MRGEGRREDQDWANLYHLGIFTVVHTAPRRE